jgi:acyl carrier protein
MIISSRTPEGEFNRCPICGARVIVEPSFSTGDAPCPRCGHLLWQFRRYYQELFGIEPELVTPGTELIDRNLGADSLDTVEAVMGLEEEFAVALLDTAAGQIRTVGDAIRWIAAERQRKARGD